MASPPYERLYDDIEEGLGFAAVPPPESPLKPRVLLRFCSECFACRLSDWYHTRPKNFSPSIKSFRQCIIWQLILAVFIITLITFRLIPPEVLHWSDVHWAKSAYSAYFIWPPSALYPAESLRYVVFQPQRKVNQPTQALYQTFDTPQVALESLFDPQGVIASDSQLAQYFSHSQFDVVWTWVNGSDPLHRRAMIAAEAIALAKRKARFGRSLNFSMDSEGLDLALQRRKSPLPKLYRDHNELRYSIRSVLTHFAPHVHRFHVLSGDFPSPLGVNTSIADLSLLSSIEANSSSRVGQIPQWLTDGNWPSKETWEHRGIELELHHHAQFFEEYSGTNFNSYAIESQIGRVNAISEHFIYMNDDYFMATDLSPADFYTRKYGMVLRMQSDLLVTSSNPSTMDPFGEWRALQYSNWLLDRRYGSRDRPYLAHAPKSISLSVFQELTALTNGTDADSEAQFVLRSFHDALLRTSQHLFRGQHTSEPDHDDAYAMFLFGHHVVERWREILLWSWVVGRIGGSQNEWRPNLERMTAWLELGGIPRGQLVSSVDVVASVRNTLDEDVVNKALGRESTGHTSYVFSSVDGYPYAFTRSGVISSWPQFTPKSAWSRAHPSIKVSNCTILLERCFPEWINKASRAFTYIAFERSECGDCIIRSLVASSGPTGLKAFLPDRSRVLRSSHPHSSYPRLPLGTRWFDINYSLKDVVFPWIDSGTQGSTINLREWTLRAMARYHFVLGYSTFEFIELQGIATTKSKLSHLSESIAKDQVAMICINDGMSWNVDQVDSMFRDWMEKTWPVKANWESR